MSFAIDISQLVTRAKGRTDDVVQKITMELFRAVILRTPVDTGRARGNWECTVGRPGTKVDQSAADRAGSGALSAASGVVSKTPAGSIVYLSNNLPYIRRLEYGYSKQAPVGMVRVSAEFIAAHYAGSIR